MIPNPQALAEELADEYICAVCGKATLDYLKHTLKQAVIEEIEQATEAQTEEAKEAEKKARHDRIFNALFKRLEPHEAKFATMLKGVWEQERKIIISNLKKLKKSYSPATQKDPEDTVDQILYPTVEFEKELSDEAKALFILIMDEAGQEELASLGIDIAFDVHNPEVTKWLEEYTPMFSKRLEEVNIEKLRKELIEGLEKGENIRKLSERVNKTYDNWNKVRSKDISQNQVLRASNQANLESYKQSGVVHKKEWITHFTDGTCFWCGSLDGETVALEKNFYDLGDTVEMEVDGKTERLYVDYENIERPPLHNRCRCAIGPWVEG